VQWNVIEKSIAFHQILSPLMKCIVCERELIFLEERQRDESTFINQGLFDNII